MTTEIVIPKVEFTPPIDFEEWLKEHDASIYAVDFCRERGFDFMRCWNECPYSDWMLWLLSRLKVEADISYRLFACWCVRQVWHLLTDERSRNAVIISEKYALGQATEKELDAARDAAMAAARAAAMDAAWAAARDAEWAAAAEAQSDKLREIFIPTTEE